MRIHYFVEGLHFDDPHKLAFWLAEKAGIEIEEYSKWEYYNLDIPPEDICEEVPDLEDSSPFSEGKESTDRDENLKMSEALREILQAYLGKSNSGECQKD